MLSVRQWYVTAYRNGMLPVRQWYVTAYRNGMLPVKQEYVTCKTAVCYLVLLIA